MKGRYFYGASAVAVAAGLLAAGAAQAQDTKDAMSTPPTMLDEHGGHHDDHHDDHGHGGH